MTTVNFEIKNTNKIIISIEISYLYFQLVYYWREDINEQNTTTDTTGIELHATEKNNQVVLFKSWNKTLQNWFFT